MIALQEPLINCVSSFCRKLKAAIIDDELITVDEKSVADWIALKESLQKDSDLYTTVSMKMNDLGLSLDTPPTSADLVTVVDGFTIENDDVKRAIGDYINKPHVLKIVETFLRGIGFDIMLFTKRPNINELQDVDLCMIDYQILPEDISGETAVQLIKDLMAASVSPDKSPPMVVLMSKAITNEEVETWDDVATKAGYFQFNYAFMNKEDFQQDSSIFSLLLLNLLQHKPIADCYYSQIRCLQAEAEVIGTRVMADFFQITPPEVQVFKMGVEKEGRTLSEEFTSLYTEHFAMGLKNSAAVQDRMRALEKVISEQGVLPPPRKHRHALHKLYARLLHLDRTCASQLPPEFGDIYADSEQKYLLVVSQECDLVVRKKGPRADRVLAVEGVLSDVDVSRFDADSIVAKPILSPQEDKLQWIWWDVRKPVVVLYNDLVEGVLYKKLWRLRFQDAEDIQHKFSSTLTKIGLDPAPQFIVTHTCKLFSERSNDFLPSSVTLYEITQDGHSLVALAASDSRALFFGLKYPFLSLEKILPLGRFHPRSEFIAMLKRDNIFVCEHPSGLVLFRSKSGTLPSIWSPWVCQTGVDSTVKEGGSP